MEFTLLTKEQIYEETRLEVLKQYGMKCAFTDFTLFLGISTYDNDSSFHLDEEPNLCCRCCSYTTRTKFEVKGYRVYDTNLYQVWYDGNTFHFGAGDFLRYNGIRPVIAYTTLPQEIECTVKHINGVTEVQYGEYPQTIVNEQFSNILEDNFNKKTLKKTNRKFTTDSIDVLNFSTPFTPQIYTEYEFNGNKYIRVIAGNNGKGKTLSDGRKIEKGKVYYIKVLPLIWLKGEKEKVLISKYAILSGLQYNYFENSGKRTSDNSDFPNTSLGVFLNRIFANEIKPNQKVLINKEENQETNDTHQLETTSEIPPKLTVASANNDSSSVNDNERHSDDNSNDLKEFTINQLAVLLTSSELTDLEKNICISYQAKRTTEEIAIQFCITTKEVRDILMKAFNILKNNILSSNLTKS